MPLAFLMAALCTGLTLATIWVALGASALAGFAVYVVSGHLMIAGLLAMNAIRTLR
jgi:hypothetical protein